MKQILFFIFCPIVLFSQVQIGDAINGEAANDRSGWSVSLSSDGLVVAIGAIHNNVNGPESGHVRVYENLGGVWTQVGQDIDGEATYDQSGHSVSLSSDGSIVAIGAHFNTENGNESGHVRVYENLGGVWTQVGQDIDGEAVEDESGYSVSLSSNGSIVAIGAPYNDGNGSDSGHVRIFENVSGVWTQIDPDIDGEAANDESGYSVSLSSDGSVVAIGAPINDGNGSESGHVRIYENISGVWTQVGADIYGEAAYDRSGWSVSLSSNGSVVAIGSRFNDGNGTNFGHVRVYENISGVWTQLGQDIDGEDTQDQLGWSVSLSSNGSVVAIGTPLNDENGTDSGHVRIYENISGAWTQVGADIYGEAAYDKSGNSVSLSSDGSVVAIGAHNNGGNGNNSGQVRIFDISGLLSNTEFELANHVTLYPNPTSKTLHIEATNNITTLEVYNVLGQKILSSKPNALNKTLDMSQFNNGMYLVKVTSGEKVSTYKVIKQ